MTGPAELNAPIPASSTAPLPFKAAASHDVGEYYSSTCRTAVPSEFFALLLLLVYPVCQLSPLVVPVAGNELNSPDNLIEIIGQEHSQG